MDNYVYRLVQAHLEDGGTDIIQHPEVAAGQGSGAQQETNFSDANIALHYQNEGIEISTPLGKSIVLIGTINTNERPISYLMPYDIESLAGEKWNRTGADCLWNLTTSVRVSMIVNNQKPKQAIAHMQLLETFLKQLIRYPATQTIGNRSAHLQSFSPSTNLLHIKNIGFEEEGVTGRWFDAVFSVDYVPLENIALKKV